MGHTSILYSVFRPFVTLAARLYFRRLRVFGREKVPKDVPVVLVANHQSALMDALLCCLSNHRQVTFLTRADIFQGKIANAALRGFNMLPIYRKRDMVDQIAMNKATFEVCNDRLAKNSIVGIFPEGNHGGSKKIRPLKKGVARMVHGAEQAHNNALNIHIVPVGLEYANYFKPQRPATVRYGEAIPVSNYLEDMETNPPVGYHRLMKDIELAMDGQMTNVRNPRVYEAIVGMEEFELDSKEIANFTFLKKVELATRKWIGSEATDTPDWQLAQQYEAYTAQLQEQNLHDKIVAHQGGRNLIGRPLLSILLLPFFVLGWLLNIVPHLLASGAAAKMVKDPLFQSSIHLASGLIFYPIIWVVEGILLAVLAKESSVFGIVLILAPCCGIIAREVVRMHRKWLGHLRFVRFKNKQPGAYDALIAKRDALLSTARSLANS